MTREHWVLYLSGGSSVLATFTVQSAVAGPLQIISGGQTGVDRAALDAALEAHVAISGWCPRGRRAEDGTIPSQYPLRETAARSYAVRTEWNVRDSDGTLILVLQEISSGTRLTVDSAKAQGRPCRIEYLLPESRAGRLPISCTTENSLQQQWDSVADWIRRNKIRVLNIAGPRGSSSPDVYPLAKCFVAGLLQTLFRGSSTAGSESAAASPAAVAITGSEVCESQAPRR